MSATAFSQKEFLATPVSGEPLPWLDENGRLLSVYQEAFCAAAFLADKAHSGAAIARAVWEQEASPAEKKLAMKLARSPDAMARWVLAGVDVAGLAPELAHWRRTLREQQLAHELAGPLSAQRHPSPNALGAGALGDNPLALAARFALTRPLSTLALIVGVWALLGALANGLSAVFLPFCPWALAMGVLAAVAEQRSLFNPSRKRPASVLAWLWFRSRLPAAGSAASRESQKAAREHWLAHGASGAPLIQLVEFYSGFLRHRGALARSDAVAKTAHSASLGEDAATAKEVESLRKESSRVQASVGMEALWLLRAQGERALIGDFERRSARSATETGNAGEGDEKSNQTRRDGRAAEKKSVMAEKTKKSQSLASTKPSAARRL